MDISKIERAKFSILFRIKLIIQQGIKDNELNKPSLKIDIDPTNLENSLKVIEYGIKEKKALEKKFNKITKIINKGKSISDEDEESVIIEEKDLQQILSEPPSKQVSAFIKNIQ